MSVIPKISYIGSSGTGVPEVLIPLNIRHYYSRDEISLCFDRSDVDLVIYDDTDADDYDLEKKIKEHDIFGISHPLSVVAQHIIQKQKQEQEQEQEQNNE